MPSFSECLKALSLPRTGDIISLLLSCGNSASLTCVSENIGISKPAVSKCLAVLENAGLLASRIVKNDCGRERRYSLLPANMGFFVSPAEGWCVSFYGGGATDIANPLLGQFPPELRVPLSESVCHPLSGHDGTMAILINCEESVLKRKLHLLILRKAWDDPIKERLLEEMRKNASRHGFFADVLFWDTEAFVSGKDSFTTRIKANGRVVCGGETRIFSSLDAYRKFD